MRSAVSPEPLDQTFRSTKLPRVLGIEAAGIVESAAGGEFESGAKVLTAMGGMGRDYDGGYAECVACRPSR
jgi:NADPH:quinone reductase-like Zn-dependent oxidoreductase